MLKMWSYKKVESEREEKNKPCTLIVIKLAIVTAEKTDFKTTSNSRDKEGHFTMIKVSVSHNELKCACS